MASFRLSVRARAQLIDIYEFTETQFGAYQAEAYHAGLAHTFNLLADFPRIGQPVDELVVGFRRFRFQSHSIFYTEEAGDILIRAIIHSAQEIRPQLFNKRFLAALIAFPKQGFVPLSRGGPLQGNSPAFFLRLNRL